MVLTSCVHCIECFTITEVFTIEASKHPYRCSWRRFASVLAKYHRACDWKPVIIADSLASRKSSKWAKIPAWKSEGKIIVESHFKNGLPWRTLWWHQRGNSRPSMLLPWPSGAKPHRQQPWDRPMTWLLQPPRLSNWKSFSWFTCDIPSEKWLNCESWIFCSTCFECWYRGQPLVRLERSEVRFGLNRVDNFKRLAISNKILKKSSEAKVISSMQTKIKAKAKVKNWTSTCLVVS